MAKRKPKPPKRIIGPKVAPIFVIDTHNIVWTCAKPTEGPCWCYRCAKYPESRYPMIRRMHFCPLCNDKRCPKAAFHDNDCEALNAIHQKMEVFFGRSKKL